MKSILDIHIKTGDFDHGYLLVGDFEGSRKTAQEASKKILSSLTTNPDFFYQKFQLFGIDESRELKERVSQRPFGEKKVFIVELDNFSFESANALLKTLEEPYPGTYFFILIPSLLGIPRTLISRLTVIDNSGSKKILDGEKAEFYKRFLTNSPEKRLEMIKKIEKREEAIEFLNELELTVEDFGILKEIQRCKNFLFNQGSSPKMILEHIALALPKM